MNVTDKRYKFDKPTELIKKLRKVGFKVWWWTSGRSAYIWLFIPFLRYFYIPFLTHIPVSTIFFDDDTPDIRWISIYHKHKKVLSKLEKISELSEVRIDLEN